MSETILTQKVRAEMVAAMKSGNKDRTQILRMVLSEIKAQESDHPDADPQTAVSAYGKKLKKALTEMQRLNQPERAAALKAEIAVVEEFLPRQLDDAALEKLVDATIATMGAVTAKETGKVMGAVLKAAGGAADAGKVRAVIESKLTK